MYRSMEKVYASRVNGPINHQKKVPSQPLTINPLPYPYPYLTLPYLYLFLPSHLHPILSILSILSFALFIIFSQFLRVTLVTISLSATS